MENMRKTKYIDKTDKEVIRLCDAINSVHKSIYTVSSCCGHGKDNFIIWFEAKNMRKLPQLLYWFDGCHTGEYGWRTEIYTDCGKSFPRMALISPTKGNVAYKSANIIAEYIENHVKLKEAYKKLENETK